MRSPTVAPRRYRWGKFQGVVLILMGLAGLLDACFEAHPFHTLFPAVFGLVGGIGLLKKRKFGVVMLGCLCCSGIYNLSGHLEYMIGGMLTFDIPFFVVPLIFYYPKRWKELSPHVGGIASDAEPNATGTRDWVRVLLPKLRSAGTLLLGVAGLLAVLIAAALLLGAAEWISEHVLPWLLKVSVGALVLLIAVVLPVALIRRSRPYAPIGLLVAAFVFGITVWMDGLLLTAKIWGDGAVVFGLLLAGVGVVPVAMLATLLHGMWARLAELVILTILAFGSQALGGGIAALVDREERARADSIV